MTQKFSNNAASLLASGITAGSTSLSVKAGDGAKFPTLGADDFFLLTLYQLSGSTEVNIEIVKVTAASGDTFTITRAQEGTTARAYNANDPVQLRFTAGTADRALQGATGGAGNFAFFENDNTVSADYTVSTGRNAMAAGPITINSGVTVTVPAGSVLTII